MAKLVLAAEVEQDISEAYNWYESHRYGLGEEFSLCDLLRISGRDGNGLLYLPRIHIPPIEAREAKGLGEDVMKTVPVLDSGSVDMDSFHFFWQTTVY